MPSGMAAISNPTVSVLPCSECAYGAASPQDGDGDLRELIAGKRKHLGRPQRAELRDGENLPVGRALLGCPAMTAQRGCLGRLTCWVDGNPSGLDPGLPGFSPELGPRPGCHLRRSLSARDPRATRLAWLSHTIAALDHIATPSQPRRGWLHCVTLILLNVPDRGALGKGGLR